MAGLARAMGATLAVGGKKSLGKNLNLYSFLNF